MQASGNKETGSNLQSASTVKRGAQKIHNDQFQSAHTSITKVP